MRELNLCVEDAMEHVLSTRPVITKPMPLGSSPALLILPGAIVDRRSVESRRDDHLDHAEMRG